jgi:DNA-binding NarL/FixJ family response regulator
MAITVSIVEDIAPTRDLLASILAKAPGFECLSCYADGEAAVEELPALAPDVVLMDINLPGINGVECVRRLKPLLPATQFMMLTVYEDSNSVFDALASGATGYLMKNTPARELFAAIREIHRGGSPMAGNIARKVIQTFHAPAPAPEPTADPEADRLTGREKQVLELLAEGQLYKEIAETLQVSVPTVCTHIRRIYEKLHVRSRAQAVARYLKQPATPNRGGSA